MDKLFSDFMDQMSELHPIGLDRQVDKPFQFNPEPWQDLVCIRSGSSSPEDTLETYKDRPPGAIESRRTECDLGLCKYKKAGTPFVLGTHLCQAATGDKYLQRNMKKEIEYGPHLYLGEINCSLNKESDLSREFGDDLQTNQDSEKDLNSGSINQ